LSKLGRTPRQRPLIGHRPHHKRRIVVVGGPLRTNRGPRVRARDPSAQGPCRLTLGLRDWNSGDRPVGSRLRTTCR
jgi:hypothetical protein